MKSKLQLLLCLLFATLAGIGNTKAQDLLFSQYFYTPFITNPGMIGANNDINITFNYRHQPVQAGVSFNTPMLSITYPFYSKTTGKPWGVLGVSALNDNAGDFIKTAGGSLAFAYNLDLGTSTLSIGALGGVYQVRYDLGGITTASMFDGTRFDAALPTGETLGSDARMYPTFSGGAMWHMSDDMGRQKAFIGASYMNINQPITSFYEGAGDADSKVPGMLIATGGYNFMLMDDKFSIMPNVRYANRLGDSHLNAGSWFRYHMGEKPNSVFSRSVLGAGAWYNNHDKVVVGGEFSTPAFLIAATYDIPLSSQATRVLGSGTFEVTASLKLQKGAPESDRDGDGIIDKEDVCPDEPGEAELQGCPDKDGDKIADKYDACPDEAGKEEFQGCPDTDGDGLPDKYDQCPEEAGKEEFQGCPDRDNDGVADRDDECPDTPGEKYLAGCTDKDKDGIRDKEDRCPDEPGPASNNGCPIETEARLLEIASHVLFETGTAVINPISYPLLDLVVDVVKSHPNKSDVLDLDGHTDSVGEEEANLTLSINRAEAVKAYLVSKGIGAEQVKTQGHGELKPIDTNDTEEGRQRNRRVEMKFIPSGGNN